MTGVSKIFTDLQSFVFLLSADTGVAIDYTLLGKGIQFPTKASFEFE